jgi:hypothetical protein
LYVQYLDGEFVIPGVLGHPATSYTHPGLLPVGDELMWKVRGVCNGVGGPYSVTANFHILFADVPEPYPARASIEKIYARPNYISDHCGLDGAGQLKFCPTATLLRKNAARWLLKAKYGPAYVPPAATGIFFDVPANDEFAPWIEELYRLGITGGCGPGLFCPNAPLTRGQAAVLFLLAKEPPGWRPPACWIRLFSDVPCSAPFADYINEIAWRSVALGCDNTNYCPSAALTREDASIWINKLFFGN